MADISYVQKEGLEDTNEAMEVEDDDDVDDNLPDGPGSGMLDSVGGSGDEGEQDPQLLKLQQYVVPDANFSRQRIGRILVEIFRTAVNNERKLAMNDVMEPIEEISLDTNAQVRSDLIEQLPHVAIIYQEAPHLFEDVFHDHLLRIIIKYIHDQENQIRAGAQTAVVTLLKGALFDSKTIEGKICPAVTDLLHMKTEYIISGISLMSKMAPLIGEELTEKLFLEKYIDLCEDPEFYVRKICVSHFGEFCAAVGRKALFRRLYPIFVDLCGDKVWGVRKACVDVMIPVSCCLSLQHRRALLAEILATHLNDESKWVRMSAFQILGPFISTFSKQFSEVTYNENCELVFTHSGQNTHFSLGYSYESINPLSKYAIRMSEPKHYAHDQKDFTTKDAVESSVRRAYREYYKSKIEKKHFENEKIKHTDDTEQYNPFLYYYIPPDLPLDDDLVKAAKKSTAEKKIFQKSTENNPESPTTREQPTEPFEDVPSEDIDSNCPFFEELEMVSFNGQEIVPYRLVDFFVSMAEPGQYSDIGADIRYNCAFSFPAVVFTLGRENWPYLREAYQSLAGANQWKIRRSLASSIHEIANILGEELTASDLVPIYDGFIRDLDEVRIGVLKHLAVFLKILKPTDRCQYLPRLKDFLATDNDWNWRFREELATQLLEAVNLFSPSDVGRYVAPLSLRLLADKVAAVRHVALYLVTRIVEHQSDNEHLVMTLFQELRYTLGVYAKKWIRRQTFAFVCAHLISGSAISGDRFSQEMLPSLLKLSWDKVPNVRLAVARTLSRNVITMGPDWLGPDQAEEVEKRLKQMRLDPDRDVRVLAGGDEHDPLDIIAQKYFPNSLSEKKQFYTSVP